jgi:hypothetical protein
LGLLQGNIAKRKKSLLRRIVFFVTYMRPAHLILIAPSAAEAATLSELSDLHRTIQIRAYFRYRRLRRYPDVEAGGEQIIGRNENFGAM